MVVKGFYFKLKIWNPTKIMFIQIKIIIIRVIKDTILYELEPHFILEDSVYDISFFMTLF